MPGTPASRCAIEKNITARSCRNAQIFVGGAESIVPKISEIHNPRVIVWIAIGERHEKARVSQIFFLQILEL
jgi:hypothetical protein